MGQDVDQALNDLATTRAALERDVDELFSRLPEPAALAGRAKTYGAAAGGAAVTVGLLAARQRRRSERRARRMEARINAEELARAFSTHEPPPPRESGRLGLVVLLAALAGVGLTALRSRSHDDHAH